jgi:FixJ family two-component response regulator
MAMGHDSWSRTGQTPVQEVPIISIIDDDDSVRVATKSLVRSLGFGAHTFASAAEFLQSPYLDDTACVITDVAMPGMSGIDMQDALIERGYRMPVIFITAFPEQRARERALNAGAIGFLSKPFDGRAMIECLRTALERNAGR